MKLYFGLFLLTAAVLSVNAQNGAYNRILTGNLRSFTKNLYRTLNGRAVIGENMVFSPMSIFESLGMVLAGARANTQFEIKRVMRLSPRLSSDQIHNLMRNLHNNIVGRNDGTTTKIANSMFLQENYSVNPAYKRRLQNEYKALVDLVNFADAEGTANRINEWVANHTENLIQDLISSDMLNGLTRLVLVNAIYFKGKWKHSFKDMRKPMLFNLRNGETINVMGMQQDATIQYKSTRQMTYIRIPYEATSPEKNRQTHLVIGISRRITGPLILSSELWEEANWYSIQAKLFLPKFMVTQMYDMKAVLKRMGIRDLFNQSTSDLSGITDEEALTVSDFVHKAFIKVNEEGTEAAAATAIIVRGRSLGGPPRININQPFVFGIYNTRAEAFTFLGKIEHPEYEE